MIELDPLVRVVYETQDDGPKRLRVSGLASFKAIFGEELLVQFCRCYIHAERLESLVSFLHSSLEKQGSESAAAYRLHLTFHTFMVGTLFEAVTALNALRAELNKRGVFDDQKWSEGLQKWLEWVDRSPWVRRVRSKAAFHVDSDWMRDGIRALAEGDPGFSIMVADSGRSRDSYMVLAHEALIVGSQKEGSDILKTVDADAELHLLSLKDALGMCLHDALNRAGLKPILEESHHVETIAEEALRISQPDVSSKPQGPSR